MMHAMMLLAAMSAYSAETTFVASEVPQAQATAAPVAVAPATWEWSGVFDWLKVPFGLFASLR
ncbi:MAG: hypothetical protein ACI4RD_05215 [Kiritimatiellia bacterium]